MDNPRYRCNSCKGEGRQHFDEDDRRISEICYHCRGQGQVSLETAIHDRHECLVSMLAESIVNQKIRACDHSDHGEGWGFHAAENGMSKYEYTAAKIWDESGRIQHAFANMDPTILNAMCDLAKIPELELISE